MTVTQSRSTGFNSLPKKLGNQLNVVVLQGGSRDSADTIDDHMALLITVFRLM
jgi:hypothetical protein